MKEMPAEVIGAGEKKSVEMYGEPVHEAPGHDVSHEMYSLPVELSSGESDEKFITADMLRGRTSIEKPPL
jgi:hypothetical protein